jgi:hypothetical protein
MSGHFYPILLYLKITLLYHHFLAYHNFIHSGFKYDISRICVGKHGCTSVTWYIQTNSWFVNCLNILRFEVLMAVKMEFVTPYSLVGCYQHSSGMFVTTYKTTQCHNLEDHRSYLNVNLYALLVDSLISYCSS